jgi:hypothetical protein
LQLRVIEATDILGPPAAVGKGFAALWSGFTVSALTKVTAPTGDYTSDRIINLARTGGSFSSARRWEDAAAHAVQLLRRR